MVEPLERALALSSKLFIALIPTTILTSSVFGADTSSATRWSSGSR